MAADHRDHDFEPLSGPHQAPADGGPARQLVILLHGLGADGNDLIGLAPHWAKSLPGAKFIAPHAPFPCDMAPMGYQWFSMAERTPEALAKGVRRAQPRLEAFIESQMAETGLGPDKVALVGFSQGTIMALQVALRRQAPLAGVVGFSGALLDTDGLAEAIGTPPPILLIHGDADEVLPVDAMHQAVATLGGLGVPCQWHVCPGLGHGIDETGLTMGAAFLEQCLQ